MKTRIQKNINGHDTVYIHGATVSKLSPCLNGSIPFVWVLGHVPNTRVEWWRTRVPLNRSDYLEAKVRLLSYDLQLSTKEFLSCVSSFDDHGLDLVQSYKAMPDTLDILRVPEEQQDNVLIKNGAFLRIWLPHSVETACVTCYQPGYLETVLG